MTVQPPRIYVAYASESFPRGKDRLCAEMPALITNSAIYARSAQVSRPRRNATVALNAAGDASVVRVRGQETRAQRGRVRGQGSKCLWGALTELFRLPVGGSFAVFPETGETFDLAETRHVWLQAKTGHRP